MTINKEKRITKMNLNFGIPAIRIKKEEKYPNDAVLTFEPVLKEGAGRKMHLNTKALEYLNINDNNNQVSFSFSGANIYIVNTSGETNASGLKVGKTTNSFSDKKHYNFVKKNHYNMNDEDILELFLIETQQEFNGNKVYELVKRNNNLTNNQNIDLEDDVHTNYSEYNQEQLDMLNSKEYEKKINTISQELTV